MKEEFLKETPLLDFSSPSIQKLIEKRKWRELPELLRIQAIYTFVQNEILFGYNQDDKRKASLILKDGYGQCNTKGILLMALLRATGIPCRIHGFYIDKKMQKGPMQGFVYKKAPQKILHSWVEVFYEDQIFELEGFILDSNYLKKIQKVFSSWEGEFIGYGIGVKDLQNPPIEFQKNSTYIQKEGIIEDLWIYDSPDELLKIYKQRTSWLTAILYRNLGRHLMNKEIKKIRKL